MAHTTDRLTCRTPVPVEIILGRQKKQPTTASFVLFDVLYEDGSRSSNRKVPGEMLDGLDGDDPARTFIMSQDQKIAEMSGQPRGPIKSLTRSAKQ
ncbi:hypothetical protein [Oceanibaculum pacificum]|uniref:hypothetical protein n=1 Tax=Oceanibaculum pacificum TaxID=580166 RepID=UPI001E35ECE2|nr:hypothetical protein [Oceanibaculum pacificum]